MTVQNREDGFTLIEALVAMAVLAAGAVGLLTAVERHVQLSRALGDRTVARWAAENRLAEMTLGLVGTESGSEMLIGQTWRTEAALTATADPDLVEISVSAVDPAETSGRALLSITAFLDRVTLPEEVRP